MASCSSINTRRHRTGWPALAGLLTLGMLLVTAAGCGNRSQGNWSPNLQRVSEIRDGLGGGTVASGGGAAASDEQPTGWATLKGRFKVNGTPPTLAALKVDKDMDVCAPGGVAVPNEGIIVGSDGSLKNAVIYLTSKISGDEPWTHPDAKPVDPANADEVEFDQKQCIFLSHVLAMKAGQNLKILNSDPVGHNTNIAAQKSSPFNQTIPSDSFAMYQPTGEESTPVSVKCSIHPWMSAWLLTRKNGYFAVSSDDGSFEIPNLPAGVELEFRVWHEVSKMDQVTVNGQAAKWSKGKFKLRLDSADEAKNSLDVAVDASLFQ